MHTGLDAQDKKLWHKIEENLLNLRGRGYEFIFIIMCFAEQKARQFVSEIEKYIL